MRIKLNEYWIKKMLELPESGMGYQHVEVRLKDGTIVKEGFVYNAEELELPDVQDIKLDDISEITLKVGN